MIHLIGGCVCSCSMRIPAAQEAGVILGWSRGAHATVPGCSHGSDIGFDRCDCPSSPLLTVKRTVWEASFACAASASRAESRSENMDSAPPPFMLTSFSRRPLRVSSRLLSIRSCSSSRLRAEACPSLSASFCFCFSRNFLCARLQCNKRPFRHVAVIVLHVEVRLVSYNHWGASKAWNDCKGP